MHTAPIKHPASYRDPSGFIYMHDGKLYRQVNKVYSSHFDFLMSSGLYQKLVDEELLLPHSILQENFNNHPDWYTTLQPAYIPFISYPYEWCFDMLKNAALLTLQLLKKSLRFGMILKDASAYNIQWHKDKLVFIDSLSFEKYEEGKPWIAYRQFCEQFLAPLLITHYNSVPLQPLFLAYPDGMPVNICAQLLPGRSKLSLYTYLHIHLHSRVSKKQKTENNKELFFSKTKLLNLLNSLESLVKALHQKEEKSTWSGYYKEVEGRNDYLQQKKEIIINWLENSTAKTAVDLGANEGEFSSLLSNKNIQTIATDFDPFCINHLYKAVINKKVPPLLPLVIDLANPSPANGVNNTERTSFINRTSVDLALALALIHHLSIGKNIPFKMVAEFFHSICFTLIIEFVPKQDEKIKLMLQQKKDIYNWYTEENFINEFSSYFNIIKKQAIAGTERVLYLMEKK